MRNVPRSIGRATHTCEESCSASRSKGSPRLTLTSPGSSRATGSRLADLDTSGVRVMSDPHWYGPAGGGGGGGGHAAAAPAQRGGGSGEQEAGRDRGTQRGR